MVHLNDTRGLWSSCSEPHADAASVTLSYRQGSTMPRYEQHIGEVHSKIRSAIPEYRLLSTRAGHLPVEASAGTGLDRRREISGRTYSIEMWTLHASSTWLAEVWSCWLFGNSSINAVNAQCRYGTVPNAVKSIPQHEQLGNVRQRFWGPSVAPHGDWLGANSRSKLSV